MISENQEKIKKLSITLYLIQTIFMVIIIVYMMITMDIGFIFLTYVFLFGFLICLFFFILCIIHETYFLIIKKIEPFYLLLFMLSISLNAGGIRSISLMFLFVVPIVTAALEEDIFKPSIFGIILYTVLLVLWLIPETDRFLMRFNIFPINALIFPNTTYIIFFYSVFISIFIFSYRFIVENKKYREIIENNTKQLKKAKNQIEQKEKQKTIAFTNIFHEIKTPLTLISNYVEKHIKNYGASEEIKIARDNIDKLKRDILNALDFEKLDRGMTFYDHSQITDISDIVKMNIFMYKELAYRKNVKMKYNIQDYIYTKIDKKSIDRIINNLLDNAIKYTPSNGEINITLKADNKNIELIIKDTGIGISKEELKNIFKPYYQISHNKRNIQGIGMGLNIVKEIITKVNGKIEVESEKDKGTTFIIKLKRYSLKERDQVEFMREYKSSTIDVMSIELKKVEHKKNRHNVFVVEDNIQMLSYLQESLFDKYNFYYAVNGKNALEKIEKIPIPDIIISDIMMDEMDGYKFYDELNKKDEKYKSIPFIYLTAKTLKDEKIKGLKKGAIDFISKPFLMEELLAKIESLIGFREALKHEKLNEITEKIYELFSENTKFKAVKEGNRNVEEKGKKNEILYLEYGISRRQIEIISLLKKGYERKEIAGFLNITTSTVNTQIERLFKKFNVNNKIDLINMINKK